MSDQKTIEMIEGLKVAAGLLNGFGQPSAAAICIAAAAKLRAGIDYQRICEHVPPGFACELCNHDGVPQQPVAKR